MKLYFETSKGEKRVIAAPLSEENAIEIIHAFCEERNFKIYYTRSWIDKEGLKWYDVGSHTEFFILEK